MEPPICHRCLGDWDKAGEDAKWLQDGNDEILATRPEALKSTDSEVVHQMRRMNEIEEPTVNIEEGWSLSRKRSRLEGKLEDKPNVSNLKMPKKAKLEGKTVKSRATSVPRFLLKR